MNKYKVMILEMFTRVSYSKRVFSPNFNLFGREIQCLVGKYTCSPSNFRIGDRTFYHTRFIDSTAHSHRSCQILSRAETTDAVTRIILPWIFCTSPRRECVDNQEAPDEFASSTRWRADPANRRLVTRRGAVYHEEISRSDEGERDDREKETRLAVLK